jgi:hypothetical protein
LCVWSDAACRLDIPSGVIDRLLLQRFVGTLRSWRQSTRRK